MVILLYSVETVKHDFRATDGPTLASLAMNSMPLSQTSERKYGVAVQSVCQHSLCRQPVSRTQALMIKTGNEQRQIRSFASQRYAEYNITVAVTVQMTENRRLVERLCLRPTLDCAQRMWTCMKLSSLGVCFAYCRRSASKAGALKRATSRWRYVNSGRYSETCISTVSTRLLLSSEPVGGCRDHAKNRFRLVCSPRSPPLVLRK